ncbi:MAG: hypothetical protein J6A77_03995 [Lachnospiraceae bacterium]|nr:hypothetical protein [Lachnospiraceae bacterium]
MNLMSTLNIFLAVCFVPLLFIQYFVLRNEGKPKNNLILSTTLPKEAWEDERVIVIRKQFYRNLNITCLVLLVLYLPALFMEYFSIQMSYIMLWLDAILIVPSIPYCRAVKKLRDLKKANWYHPELKKIQVADTSLASVFEERQNIYTFVHFLLPLLVSLVPLLYPLAVPVEGPLTALCIIVLCNSSCILMCWFIYRFMLRKKTDRVSSDITLSAVLTRIRRYYWGKFWLYLSWASAIFGFSSLLLFISDKSFLVTMSLFTLAVLALSLGMELKIRAEQQRLNKEQPSEILVDEDDYWPYGAFYYNKNDSSLMVNSRVGLGTTVNVAHPVGMGLSIFTIIMLLLLPFTGVFLKNEEFTDPKVVLTETTVEAWHTGKEYEIPLEDILSVELLSELPDTYKNAGTNFPHLYKGSFTVKGIDNNCRVCLDPYDPLFLVVTTKEKYYIFSMEKAEELRNIYESILRKY